MNPAEASRTLSLFDYVRPVLSRWWVVVAVVVAATSGTYAYYDRQPFVYKASTRLYTTIGPETQAINPLTQDTLARQSLNAVALLTSRNTARSIAPKLSFRADPAALARSLTATRDDESSFITITATRPTGQQAAELANVVAREFIASQTAAARRGLERYLAQLQEQSERLPRTQANTNEVAAIAASIRLVRLQLSLLQGTTAQLDPAIGTSAPVSPRPKRNAVFALFLSLLVAVALTFVLERFDRRLKRVEDIEDAYGMPLLAVLPHAKVPAQFGVAGEAEVAPELLEAFRQLRTNVQLESLERPVRRILVTSAVTGEGKSTVVRNLAIAYREFGRSVVVVDADLRKPTQGTLFAVSGSQGLTTVLTGESTLRGALIDVPVDATGTDTLARIQAATTSATATAAPVVVAPEGGIDGVGLLMSGGRIANPQAVLAAGPTVALLEQLQEQADIVIIDSPPVLAVSDALTLARDADAVIVVARIGLSTHDGAVRARAALDRVPGVRLAGVVVNDLSLSDSARYGYGDGYGATE